MALEVVDPTVIAYGSGVYKEKLRPEFDKIAANFIALNELLLQSSAGWYVGIGVPSGSLGALGDNYLNLDPAIGRGDVYTKTGSSLWTLTGSLLGPAGDVGVTAVNGDEGPDVTINLDNIAETPARHFLTPERTVAFGSGLKQSEGTVLSAGLVAAEADFADTPTAIIGDSPDKVMSPALTYALMSAKAGSMPWTSNQDGGGYELLNYSGNLAPFQSGNFDFTTATPGDTIPYTGAGVVWTIPAVVAIAGRTVGFLVINEGSGAITLSPSGVTINGDVSIPAGAVCQLLFYSNGVVHKCVSRVG